MAAGTPKAIVDTLEQLHYETGANGGFILGRGFHAMDNILEFVDLVVPELQRRGLTKKKYGGRRCARTSTIERRKTGRRTARPSIDTPQEMPVPGLAHPVGT